MSEDKVNVTLKVSDRCSNDEVIDNEKSKKEKEAAAKKARVEYSKTRGPRTKGVLFRRLDDGTLINADLSEEEILRREEKKKAKIKKIQEKMEKREMKRIQAKARKEKLKDSKTLKTQDLVQSPSRGKKNERAPPEQPKAKTYTPAPPPSVSAWKAGKFDIPIIFFSYFLEFTKKTAIIYGIQDHLRDSNHHVPLHKLPLKLYKK